MKNSGVLTIIHEKKQINIPISSILYVIMDGNNAFFHVSYDKVYQTRMTLAEIEPQLGENFIKIKRGCIVSVMSIHSFGDKVNLINGEELCYAARHRKEIVDEFITKQKELINALNKSASLNTKEEYHEYYRLFDSLPIAFCDIEMIFDGEYNAVDWIFRYGNMALADLEKMPLGHLIGNTFSSVFPDMDVKWLRTYERAALYGETIKIVDYSPEIDTYLDIICFPTFKGHCGCILFDISKINSYRKATDAERAMTVFFKRLMKVD